MQQTEKPSSNASRRMEKTNQCRDGCRDLADILIEEVLVKFWWTGRWLSKRVRYACSYHHACRSQLTRETQKDYGAGFGAHLRSETMAFLRFVPMTVQALRCCLRSTSSGHEIIWGSEEQRHWDLVLFGDYNDGLQNPSRVSLKAKVGGVDG